MTSTVQDARLRILLVEDDEDDFILTRDHLEAAFPEGLELDWVDNWEDAVRFIREERHDAFLVDYYLGARTGLELIEEMTESGQTVPFVLLTGQDSPETDAKAMQAGATDYLVKGQLTAPLLNRAIRYAIQQKKNEQRLLALSEYDSLTGLANRALLRKRSGKQLARRTAPDASSRCCCSTWTTSRTSTTRSVIRWVMSC